MAARNAAATARPASKKAGSSRPAEAPGTNPRQKASQKGADRVKAAAKAAARARAADPAKSVQAAADIKNDPSIRKLLAYAKGKKSVSYDEVSDFLPDAIVHSDRIDEVIALLEKHHIKLEEEEISLEIEEEKPGKDRKKLIYSDKESSVDDPIRLYLREIGKENLLTAEQEVELSKAMESGEYIIKGVIKNSGVLVREFLRLGLRASSSAAKNWSLERSWFMDPPKTRALNARLRRAAGRRQPGAAGVTGRNSRPQPGQRHGGASGRNIAGDTGNQHPQPSQQSQTVLPLFSQCGPASSAICRVIQASGKSRGPTPSSSARARSTADAGTVARGGTARGCPGAPAGGSVASTPIFEPVCAPAGRDGSRVEVDSPSRIIESRDHCTRVASAQKTSSGEKMSTSSSTANTALQRR